MLPYLNILRVTSEKPHVFALKMTITLSTTLNYCTHFPENLQSILIVICEHGKSTGIQHVYTILTVVLAPFLLPPGLLYSAV